VEFKGRLTLLTGFTLANSLKSPLLTPGCNGRLTVGVISMVSECALLVALEENRQFLSGFRN
jgi:hypothetical protein